MYNNFSGKMINDFFLKIIVIVIKKSPKKVAIIIWTKKKQYVQEAPQEPMGPTRMRGLTGSYGVQGEPGSAEA